MRPFHLFRRTLGSDASGVALVIVLAFVVLLTGLMVAFFTRSVTSRQLSNSSAGQTRAAILAKSAADIVIAGFKKEIVDPTASKLDSYGTAPNVYNVYTPKAAINVVPVRYPLPSTTSDLIPNLIRESVRNDSIGNTLPTPAVPSYASALTTTGDTSAPAGERAPDGRAITKARWNSHFLIPSKSTATNADSTPDDDSTTGVKFTSPDWVMVTREKGPAVLTSPTKDSIGTTVTVMGRYAYAVYDEGGLLDMNVAGYPIVTPAPAPAATGFTPAQISRKGSLAMADLTQLPLVRTPSSPDPTAAASEYLSPNVVNSIVSWRNNAAAANSTSGTAPLGPFPNTSFNATQGANWLTNFVDNTRGFMTVYGGKTNNTGTTDQAFLSRQALLRLRTSLDSQGFGANALQYMGTFSRSLEQPSFVPAHIQYPKNGTVQEAPNINAVSATQPPSGSNPPNFYPLVDNYLGNNDAAGSTGSTSGQDIINPSLLTIRATTAFPRSDIAKTMAVIGEPLLKKKWPLTRLTEISYIATGSTGSNTDSAMTSTNHIKDWFGLTRTDTSLSWTYDHRKSGDSAAVHIYTLQEVASANREPDFAELLKAAINVGSLGKGGPGLHNNQGNYQYILDVATDYQVLQIMANLIDQYDTDSYPTAIRIASGSIYRTFRGVEDLPYFYRYHPFTVVTQLPSPLLSKSDTVTWYDANTNLPVKTTLDCRLASNVSGGKVVYLYAPDVWNPHDASTTLTQSGPRPAKFRLAVITDDPAGQTPIWSTGFWPKANGDWYDDIPPKTSIPGVVKKLATEASTAFTFTDLNGTLFREPTLLWRTDVPAGAYQGIATADAGSLAGPYKDINSGVSYYGVQIGSDPVSYVATVGTKYYGKDSAGNTGNTAIFQGNSVNDNNQAVPTGAYAQYTFRLQYEFPAGSGTYITYDEKYPDFHGLFGPNIIANKADYDAPSNPSNQWLNPFNTNQINDSSTNFDPRSPRFGIGTEANLGESTSGYLESNPTDNSDTKVSVLTTQRPGSDRGNHVNYSTPGMTSDPGHNAQIHWYDGVGYGASNGANASPLMYDGLLSQNDARQPLANRSGGVSHVYYEDPDGMARRAMGAYVYTGFNSNASVGPLLSSSYLSTNLEGLPLATANTYGGGGTGLGTPTAQSLSRPVILNRPFRSVGEMSYTFRGAPWKQIDFFTPESGDAGLLDVFCINEAPFDGVVAGKVNLNTHQAPVLKALIAGSARDDLKNVSGAPAYSLSPITSAEAALAGAKLVGITTDSANGWKGPLTNVSQLVGHFVPASLAPAANSPATDFLSYVQPSTGATYTYAGFSAALDASVFTSNSAQTTKIQRMHESVVRALADGGQTRVWNLMIDVVAQTGRYGPNASSLAQFSVDGESRYWIHVAIDRYTGTIIDKQVELVSE